MKKLIILFAATLGVFAFITLNDTANTLLSEITTSKGVLHKINRKRDLYEFFEYEFHFFHKTNREKVLLRKRLNSQSGLINPFIEVSSLKELEKATGYPIKIPKTICKYFSIKKYISVSSEAALFPK